MEQITINSESIKLDQFLKWANIASTGGEAKMMIKEGIVIVNGELETRRGRTLYPGDEIQIEELGLFKITHE